MSLEELCSAHSRDELVALAHRAGLVVPARATKATIAGLLVDAEQGCPPDLGADGRRLWGQVQEWLAEQGPDDADGAELEPHEVVLVAEMCRTADRLATIRGALARVDPTEAAWTRLASEERQRGLAMSRLISAVGFPTGLVDDDAKGSTPRSRRAQTAAQERWRERTQEARRRRSTG